jgi:hypothetical protein
MATKRGNGNSGHRPGGGINSREAHKQGVKVGRSAIEMRPAGVSQIGSSMGNRVTNSGRTLSGAVEPVQGKALPQGLSVPLGNQKALDVGKGGPGAGRVLYGQSGTNKQYGPAAGSPKPQGREILREFGPDVPNRR